jgi:UDP-N-acetylmuramate dehydrogenase
MNMAEPRLFPGTALRGQLLADEPMAAHVSWRAGGRADRAYVPADLADLQAFLRALPPGGPVMFVGLGSNLLVRDGGYRGTVILLHDTHGAIREDGDVIEAEAGVASPKLARFAAKHGYEGAEFLAGVPGTVGGALAMNAGCYGAETWERVREVITIDRAGDLHRRAREMFETGYRHVALRKGRLGADEWFVAGRFAFTRGNGARARARITALLEQRVATQPLNLPNAGSVFRNPPGDHAARLVEAAGLKGHAIGGARISEKHANFIVNPKGAGSAADIEALIAHAHATVLARFGVALVPEVRIIGDTA